MTTVLPYAPLSHTEAIRVQALAQKIGQKEPAGLWVQAQAMLTTDGQDVFALLLDKRGAQTVPTGRAMANRGEKVRLAAYYDRWLRSLH